MFLKRWKTYGKHYPFFTEKSNTRSWHQSIRISYSSGVNIFYIKNWFVFHYVNTAQISNKTLKTRMKNIQKNVPFEQTDSILEIELARIAIYCGYQW